MDVDDRVRDALPVNLPYDDLVAQAYDCWLPYDGNYDDIERDRTAIERGDGPALELGCGTMDLPRRYATIYNPSGSFMLLDDEQRVCDALSTWIRHLAPRGRLLVEMGVPRADFDANWEWHLRRSVTRVSDGVTFMVHEAMRCDVDAQLEHTLHRHEVWDADGQPVTTYLRRHRLRWWTAEQLERAFLESGATHVRRLGTDDEFIVIGSAPS